MHSNEAISIQITFAKPSPNGENDAYSFFSYPNQECARASQLFRFALEWTFHFSQKFSRKICSRFSLFSRKKGVRKMREMRKKICHIFGYFGPIFRKFEEFSSGFRIMTSKLNNCPYLFDYTCRFSCYAESIFCMFLALNIQKWCLLLDI